MKLFFALVIIANLAVSVNGIDVTEPAPGYIEASYEHVEFETLFKNPRYYSGRKICVPGVMMGMPGMAGQLALFKTREAHELSFQQAGAPMLPIDIMYTPALRKTFENKDVFVCGVYYVPAEDVNRPGYYAFVRVDRVRLMD